MCLPLIIGVLRGTEVKGAIPKLVAILALVYDSGLPAQHTRHAIADSWSSSQSTKFSWTGLATMTAVWLWTRLLPQESLGILKVRSSAWGLLGTTTTYLHIFLLLSGHMHTRTTLNRRQSHSPCLSKSLFLFLSSLQKSALGKSPKRETRKQL